MRIRRIKAPKRRQLWRPTSPRPLEDVSSRVSSPQSQDALPKSISSSFPHPSSARYEFGLYKYTTGVIAMRQAWLPRIALKIYSREPVQKPEVSRALVDVLNSSSPSGSLLSHLNKISEVLFKICSSSRKIEDVYFQIFGRSRNRNDNRLLSLHSNRVWNMSCQLYRHPGFDASPSKPWIELSIPEFFAKTLCKVQDRSLIVEELRLRLGFHLKPQILAADFHETEQANPAASGAFSRPIQGLVDGILEVERRSIANQVFADADEMVATVTDAVLEYLIPSALARLVDFNHLEISACGPKYQRFVVNMLLNADGSLKERPASPEHKPLAYTSPLAPDPSPQLPLNDTFGGTSLLTTGGRQVKRIKSEDWESWEIISDVSRPLSGSTQTKTGFLTVERIFYRGASSTQNTVTLKPADLFEEFDGLCKAVERNGLACVAYATALLAAKLPYTETIIELTEPREDALLSARINYSPNGGFCGIAVRVLLPSNLEFSLSGHPGEVNRLGSCKVTLYGKDRSELSQTDRNFNPQITGSDELRILTSITSAAVKGICSEVNFDSYETVPQLLAEGLFRTLQFPNPSIALEGVRVVIRLPENSPVGPCEIKAIKWRNDGTMRAQDELESKAHSTTTVPEVLDDTVRSPSLEATGRATTPPDPNDARGSKKDPPLGSEGDSILRDRVFIALGSNVGDRLQNIENACQELDAQQDVQILRTSALYETAPMYVENQDRFLNGVCEIETTLQPMQLLDKLQTIEQGLGRVKTIDKGPRNIDLDILLYDNHKLQTERLTIPHPLMLEREFVLRPLCDIPTSRRRSHGRGTQTYQKLLKTVQQPSQPMYALTNLAPSGPDIRVDDPRARTSIMSIMNLTPDSFSDGGRYEAADTEKLTSFIKTQIAAGATIIDIGGQSSRPNAADVSAEEEMSRILPAIKAVKSIPEAANVAISVDTYRAPVAQAAIGAGAHVINDISSGLLDPDMLATVSKLQCTYIMMHMRGTPATMMSEENCSYPDGLIPTISNELSERVGAAQKAGIRRWRIILDPGIGFSKTADQNLEILRDFRKLKRSSDLRNFAWLIGSSRKSFIGKITGVQEAKERGWGTAATVTAAIHGGADIVRVHDAEEMGAVVKMADAMYRV